MRLCIQCWNNETLWGLLQNEKRRYQLFSSTGFLSDCPFLDFMWPFPWVSKPEWFSRLHSYLHACSTSGSCLVLHLPFLLIGVYSVQPSGHPSCKQQRVDNTRLLTWAAGRFELGISDDLYIHIYIYWPGVTNSIGTSMAMAMAGQTRCIE